MKCNVTSMCINFMKYNPKSTSVDKNFDFVIFNIKIIKLYKFQYIIKNSKGKSA